MASGDYMFELPGSKSRKVLASGLSHGFTSWGWQAPAKPYVPPSTAAWSKLDGISVLKGSC